MPAVSSISPASGPATGGTAVTISGSNLSGTTAVKFGAVAATGVTIVSATQVTAIAPSGTDGTVDVTVTTASGTSTANAGDHYSYVMSGTTTGQVYSHQSALGVTGVARADNTHFNNPAAGAVDTTDGLLFVADTGNHRVQVIDTAKFG